MQKTARKNPPPVPQQTIQQTTGISPYVGGTSAYQQWTNIGQAFQPTIAWQDTTSNATYSSASSVLNVT